MVVVQRADTPVGPYDNHRIFNEMEQLLSLFQQSQLEAPLELF